MAMWRARDCYWLLWLRVGDARRRTPALAHRRPMLADPSASASVVACLRLRVNAPVIVLDTKCKRDVTPSSEDLAQVVAYATAWRTHEAVLVYPSQSHQPWEAHVGEVRVRALAFSIAGDLNEQGRAFLQRLRPSSGA